MCNQSFRPRATGRIEFSARLVLSSDSGYSKKRVSFFHSPSAYWQALLSALKGKAADCAASILLRISSIRGLAVSSRRICAAAVVSVLRRASALTKRREFGVSGMVTHPTCLRQQLPKCGNECGMTFFATRELSKKYSGRFPKVLHDAPLLLPADNTNVRRALDQWFDAQQIPTLCGWTVRRFRTVAPLWGDRGSHVCGSVGPRETLS
jgi:hypothetical protein